MGIPAMDMGVLLDDYELYPTSSSATSRPVGFGPRFDDLAGLSNA